jgi:hypothetical protein
MIVFRHLFTAYRKVFAWFWAIMALLLAGLCLSYEIFGHYPVQDNNTASMWEVAGMAAPRWFLFVIGLMFVTVNLPVVVAHGITRRGYFDGAALFILASSAFAASMVLLGFGVERWVYHLNGIWAELTRPYPVNSLGQAGRLWLELFLGATAYMVSGWLAGIAFYRTRVWVAIACSPLAAAPLIAVSAQPLGRPAAWELGLTAVVSALGLGLGYLFVRSVAIRPRKA